MSNPEQHHDQTELSNSQPEKIRPQSWAEYICQLGNQFQVRITQPGDTLRLGIRDTQRQLLISTYPTYVVVTHGQTTDDGVMPDEQIVFDITEDGDLTPDEILYTDEIWDEYQEKLRQSNLPSIHDLNFDIKTFAAYILDKVAREEWAKYTAVG